MAFRLSVQMLQDASLEHLFSLISGLCVCVCIHTHRYIQSRMHVCVCVSVCVLSACMGRDARLKCGASCRS